MLQRFLDALPARVRGGRGRRADEHRPDRCGRNYGTGPVDRTPQFPPRLSYIESGGPSLEHRRLERGPAGYRPVRVAEHGPSITDMSAVPSNSVDAVWSSHNLEHLYAPRGSAGLARVLAGAEPGRRRRAGPARHAGKITSACAAGIPSRRFTSLRPARFTAIRHHLRTSQARSPAATTSWRTKTAFTAASLGQKLTEAGFATVDVQADQPAFACGPRRRSRASRARTI